jgi:Nucleotidyl transferase AbiEii toxin, Type IV TA system
MLSRWVDAYARQIGQDTARVRRWIAYMALGGALEQAGFSGEGPRFTIKGGVALELRLRGKARATRDLDLVLNHPEADLAGELENALTHTCEGFSFRRRGESQVLPNGAVRVEVVVDYAQKPWARIQVDVGRQELNIAEFEMVEAIDFASLHLRFPERLPCLSLHAQAAQKLHGLTLPSRPGWRNGRFKDLVDLLLLRELITDFSTLREACEQLFAVRRTHAWPPLVEIQPDWAEPFARMASEVGLPVTDLHQAMYQIRAFLHQIDPRAPLFKPVEVSDRLTATTWYYAVASGGGVHRVPVPVAEALIRSDYDEAGEIPERWQRHPGGVLLVGVVLILRDGKPAWVERAAVVARAIRDEVYGSPTAMMPDSWRALASEVQRRAKAPSHALESLAVFLSTQHGRLPCLLGLSMGVSSREGHRYHAQYFKHGLLEGAVWDLAESQVVLPSAATRTEHA